MTKLRMRVTVYASVDSDGFSHAFECVVVAFKAVKHPAYVVVDCAHGERVGPEGLRLDRKGAPCELKCFVGFPQTVERDAQGTK